MTEAPAGGWPFPPNAIDVDATRTALVVVDMQYWCADGASGIAPAIRAMTGGDAYFDRVDHVVRPAIASLLRAWRAAGAPVVHIVSGSADPGGADLLPRIRRRRADMGLQFDVSGIYPEGSREREVLEELSPAAGEPVLNKVTTSAFTSTGIDMILRNRAVTDVVVCGVVANVCVELTARDAADRGFGVIIPEDGTAAYDEAAFQAMLATCARFYGVVTRSPDLCRSIGEASAAHSARSVQP
jgi:nicotinamidase-related amidase